MAEEATDEKRLTEVPEQQPTLLIDNGRELVERYIFYINETESPIVYHRWCFLTSLGALIGRNMYVMHGHKRIYPNLYTMLIGPPGSRKSTAIKQSRSMIEDGVGYPYFSAEKTSKEKFLLDLEGIVIDGEPELRGGGNRKKIDAVTEANLWGDEALQEPKEVFICADEFNEFAGTGNLDFYTTLGNLWDWDKPKTPYNSRLKNSRSVSIFQPTVSLLGGNTPANFARAFNAEAGELGFISRFIFIYGPSSGKRHAFPAAPNELLGDSIIRRLTDIRESAATGEIRISDNARKLLTVIYNEWIFIVDTRFEGYNSRRFTQLLKLCILSAVIHEAPIITTSIVVYANTILSAAEVFMSKARGEFGKGRHSDINDRIMNILDGAKKPMTFIDIFKLVHNDLDRQANLQEIMQSLTNSQKVQIVAQQGFLPKKTPVRDADYTDWTILTPDERKDLAL